MPERAETGMQVGAQRRVHQRARAAVQAGPTRGLPRRSQAGLRGGLRRHLLVQGLQPQVGPGETQEPKQRSMIL